MGSDSGVKLGSHDELLGLMAKQSKLHKKATEDMEKFRKDPIMRALNGAQAAQLKGTPWAATIVQKNIDVAESIEAVKDMIADLRKENEQLKTRVQELEGGKTTAPKIRDTYGRKA